MKIWETQWWHIVILGHSVREVQDDYLDGMFSHECSCGYWWFT